MYMDKEIKEFINERFFRIDEDIEMCFTEKEVIKLMSDFLSEIDNVKQ